MTKDIKQIQEHNRKAIICAVHGTDDYEEALRLELDVNCKIQTDSETIKIIELTEGQCWFNTRYDGFIDFDISDIKNERYGWKIIGKPLTLDRVLLVLQSQEVGFLDGFLFELEDKGYDGMMERWICKWKLTRQTLEEQSEETQRAINELLKEL